MRRALEEKLAFIRTELADQKSGNAEEDQKNKETIQALLNAARLISELKPRGLTDNAANAINKSAEEFRRLSHNSSNNSSSSGGSNPVDILLAELTPPTLPTP